MADKATIGGAENVYTYRYRKFTKNSSGGYDEGEWEEKVSKSKVEDGMKYSGGYKTGQIEGVAQKQRWKEYTWDESSKKYKQSGHSYSKSSSHFNTEDEASAKRVEGGSSDWGAANISKDDFLNTDGSPKTIEEIYTSLDQKLPNITGGELKLQIRDMLPKYTGEEGMKEEKGIEREGFQKDVYGISKDAGKAGAQMQQAYGSGMGSQMRGAYGAQKDVAQQFKQAEQGYEQDIYGIEKKAGEEFEAGVEDWMQGSWFETPESGVDKVTDFKQGGRVPSNKRQTFSEVLSKIPDAGGS